MAKKKRRSRREVARSYYGIRMAQGGTVDLVIDAISKEPEVSKHLWGLHDQRTHGRKSAVSFLSSLGTMPSTGPYHLEPSSAAVRIKRAIPPNGKHLQRYRVIKRLRNEGFKIDPSVKLFGLGRRPPTQFGTAEEVGEKNDDYSDYLSDQYDALKQEWVRGARSVPVQGGAIKAFGINDAYTEHLPLGINAKATTEGYRADLMQALLKNIHADTQDWFKEQGVTHVKVYRGEKFATEAERLAMDEYDRDKWEAGQTTQQPLASWTTDPWQAVNFAAPGGRIYATVLPVERILAVGGMAMGSYDESELIAIGGPVQVWRYTFGKHGSEAYMKRLNQMLDEKYMGVSKMEHTQALFGWTPAATAPWKEPTMQEPVEKAKYPSLERVPGKQNWVDHAGGLPKYIDKIARTLHYERGMPIGRAIAVAVSRCKMWAAGGDGVNPDTQAKAAAAIAQWNAKKARGKKS